MLSDCVTKAGILFQRWDAEGTKVFLYRSVLKWGMKSLVEAPRVWDSTGMGNETCGHVHYMLEDFVGHDGCGLGSSFHRGFPLEEVEDARYVYGALVVSDREEGSPILFIFELFPQVDMSHWILHCRCIFYDGMDEGFVIGFLHLPVASTQIFL